MNGKNAKKLRQIVNRHQKEMASHSWEDFFDLVHDLKFKYRVKLAWMILLRKKIEK